MAAGLAGRFTRQELAALYKCAGPEGLVQLTRDNQVCALIQQYYTRTSLEAEESAVLLTW